MSHPIQAAVAATLLVWTSYAWAGCGRSSPAPDAATSRPVAPVAGSPAQPASAPGVTSRDQLIAVVLDAVKTNRVAQVRSLFVDLDVARASCGDLLQRLGEQNLESALATIAQKAIRKLERCHEGFDWTTAQQLSVSGGEKDRQRPGCPGLEEHTDIRVTFRAGAVERTVKIDDPVVGPGGRWYVSDAPRCRTVTPN